MDEVYATGEWLWVIGDLVDIGARLERPGWRPGSGCGISSEGLVGWSDGDLRICIFVSSSGAASKNCARENYPYEQHDGNEYKLSHIEPLYQTSFHVEALEFVCLCGDVLFTHQPIVCEGEVNFEYCS